MEIVTMKALEDNFMYLLIDKKTMTCAAVDPVEPRKINDYASSKHLRVTHILTTHHHWDHSGGNNELVKLLNCSVTVCGGDKRVEGLNLTVTDRQNIFIGSGIVVECLHTPCHTTGHICYVAKCLEEQVVFTGDTLFIAGCGRFFEGTAAQMVHALINVLAKLDPATLVYCGHEYTLKNLKFALSVEPSNDNVRKKIEWANQRCVTGGCTVPSTIGEELLTNPFMRVTEQTILDGLSCSDHVSAMEILRAKKDKF